MEILYLVQLVKHCDFYRLLQMQMVLFVFVILAHTYAGFRDFSKSCQTPFAPVDSGIFTAKNAKTAKKKEKTSRALRFGSTAFKRGAWATLKAIREFTLISANQRCFARKSPKN
jgi:hypothetical protein